MFTITTGQIDALLLAWVFPMVRVMSFLATVPVFNNVAIPQRIKLIIALAVGTAVASSLPPQQLAEPGSYVGLAVFVQQILIGTGLGFCMRVIFAALDIAGELSGLQMGLSFASFFDPQTQSSTDVISQFVGIIVALVFLALNGHLLLIETLVRSFEWLPISAQPVHANGWQVIIHAGALMYASGLLLCLPIVAALFITNIALAVLSRAAPQLNLFAIGFPITSAVGIGVIWLTMPALASALQNLFDQGFELMAIVSKAWASP